MRLLNRFLYSTLIITGVLTALVSCNRSADSDYVELPSGEFRQYIAGFTSGLIDRDREITIVLQEPSTSYTVVGDELPGEVSDYLEISPALAGVLTWKNDRSITFTPSEMMRSGTHYEFEFKLGVLLDVEQRFASFPFSIYTPEQQVKVEVLNLKPYSDADIEWNQLQGYVIAADYLEDELVEGMMTFTQDGRSLDASWVHGPAGRKHTFYLDSLQRKDAIGTIKIAWDIDSDDYETNGAMDFSIPSINDFSYVKSSIERDPEQHIRIVFTDPLDPAQTLKGLVRVQGSDDLRTELNSNVLKVYPAARISGAQTVSISDQVKNVRGIGLSETLNIEMDFTELSPAVRSNFTGTILPSTDGNVFPFEAVNLRAVDVEITQIFEDNIPQFLQVNEFAGDYQIARVGRQIIKQRLDLTSTKALDFGKWNTFTLNLDEFIQQEKGAIYRITLSFRPSYSIYPCAVAVDDTGLGSDVTELGYADEEYQEWIYDDYYYYSIPGFDWDEIDNPCHISYYADKKISHNILATDIGLIAKQGKDDKMYVAVNDILTAQPIKGVEIELLDAQNQVVGTAKTDGQGQVMIESERRAHLVVATKGKEKAYLRVGDGASLSVSHFDTRGRELQGGLKGFIYGERGVWRPGDTLFLDFMLEDAQQSLPKGHPVILEVKDARGTLAHREVRNSGLNGLYDFSFSTKEDAPTGMWMAYVKVGSATFCKQLSIEAVKPNRLKMQLDFGDFIQEEQGGSVGQLKATWLHGAKAKGLKAEVEMVLSASGVKPAGYEGYIFKDPARNFTSSEEKLFEGRVDQDGFADIPLDLQLRDVAPGLLRAYFTTKVFEEGGGFSIDRFNVPYSPFDRYIGVKMPDSYRLQAGTDHRVQVVSVDKEGKPLKADGLRVDVYRVDWRWWWDSGSNYYAKYISDQSRYRVQSVELGEFTGKTEFDLHVPDHEWARYMLRVVDTRSGGHSTGATFYSYVPYRPGMETPQMPGGATALTFEMDKVSYEVGDQAKLSVPTGGVGRALVSIEDGMGVLQQEWVDVSGEQMDYRFEVTEAMAPNAYVNVTLVQPHVRENELPIRMYGISLLNVEAPKTVLHPVIDMPDKLRPESQVEIEVSEEDGRAMTYTLAIVDEGLLDLTGFKTPDPHSSFYAREALGVRTWDRYDDVIGAFGAMIQEVLSVGGDGEAEDKKKAKVNRFKPMVQHIGPFYIQAGKSKTHTLTIPNYVGSVRVMVIACQDAAYGRVEKTVKVNKPLMVLATLPRVLGPDEDVRLPVSVFAMEEGISKVDVSVELTGPVTMVGESTRSIRFTEPDEQMLFFDLKTGTGLGKATAKVTVQGGKHSAHYDIELPVRQSRLPESRSQLFVLEAGDQQSIDYQHFAMPGTQKLTLELSSMPSINLEDRLGYLTRYPHGCAEQTISQAFPQLYLKSFLTEDAELAVKSTQNMVMVLSDIGKFQMSNGSFAYWPNRGYYSDWVSSYVGHFLIEAKRAGYDIPESVYDKWLSFQQGAVKGDYPEERYYHRAYQEKARAYRLFTLALAGAPDIASMNRLKTSSLLDKPAIYLLAASYHLAGQTDVAQRLVGDHPHYTPKNRRDGYSFGSFNRDQAILLDCMAIMGMKKEALPIVMQIAEALSSDRYMDTQTTAWCLRAMLSLDILEKKDMEFSASLNGAEIASGRSQLQFKAYDLTDKAGASGSMSVVNKSNGLLYARLVETGVPSRATVQAEQSNVKLDVRYLDMDGNPMDVSRIEQGTEFYIDVTVENPNTEDPLEHLALSVVLPSGWEPNIDRMDSPVASDATDIPDYLDIRDDRVLLYFSLDKQDESRYYYYYQYKKHFRFTVNASYSGDYYMPGPTVEHMYDPEVYDRKAGKTVEVYRVGE